MRAPTRKGQVVIERSDIKMAKNIKEINEKIGRGEVVVVPEIQKMIRETEYQTTVIDPTTTTNETSQVFFAIVYSDASYLTLSLYREMHPMGTTFSASAQR